MASHVSQGMQRKMHVGHMTSLMSTCMLMEKSIKGEGNQFVEDERNKKERKGKKKERRKKEREREERDRERGGKGNRGFDGRNSSDQEVKFVYSTWAKLQEVRILPTLVYFPP